MKEILDKLKSDFEYQTGATYVGLIKAIGAGFASRLHEFLGKLKFIEKQAFISTADEEYLYLHAGELLPPKLPKKAKGTVIVVRSRYDLNSPNPWEPDEASYTMVYDNIMYKATKPSRSSSGNLEFLRGSVRSDMMTINYDLGIPSLKFKISDIFNSDNNNAGLSSPIYDGVCTSFLNPSVAYIPYIFTVEVYEDVAYLLPRYPAVMEVIKKAKDTGNTLNLTFVQNFFRFDIEAIEVGSDANRRKGDKLRATQPDVGFGGIQVLRLEGGNDYKEPLEVYRQRVIDFIANPQAPFNANNIKATILNGVPTIKYVTVKGGEYEGGKVKCFVVNGDYGITAEEKSKIIELLVAIMPVQMNKEHITVELPLIKTQDVIISGLTPSDELMQEEVSKNINFFFDTDLFEKRVTKGDIKSVIYGTKHYSRRVISFRVISGQFEAETGVFTKLGLVKFI